MVWSPSGRGLDSGGVAQTWGRVAVAALAQDKRGGVRSDVGDMDRGEHGNLQEVVLASILKGTMLWRSR